VCDAGLDAKCCAEGRHASIRPTARRIARRRSRGTKPSARREAQGVHDVMGPRALGCTWCTTPCRNLHIQAQARRVLMCMPSFDPRATIRFSDRGFVAGLANREEQRRRILLYPRSDDPRSPRRGRREATLTRRKPFNLFGGRAQDSTRVAAGVVHGIRATEDPKPCPIVRIDARHAPVTFVVPSTP
jgi:hypothetical protein